MPAVISGGGGHDAHCAFCGILNPDPNHLEHHNMRLCNQDLNRFACKRRRPMVAHLMKHHSVQSVQQGQAIADRWKTDSDKQAWSCGFCVQYFSDLEDRLKHIATEYRDNHRTFKEWSFSNVIRGLLQQPGVAAAWDNLVAAHYGSSSPCFVWNKNTIGELQSLLEKGPSYPYTSEALAEAAIAAAEIAIDDPQANNGTLTEKAHPHVANNDYFGDFPLTQMQTSTGSSGIPSDSSFSSYIEPSASTSHDFLSTPGTPIIPTSNASSACLPRQGYLPEPTFAYQANFDAVQVSFMIHN